MNCIFGFVDKQSGLHSEERMQNLKKNWLLHDALCFLGGERQPSENNTLTQKQLMRRSNPGIDCFTSFP